jgi:hypothetical protein
VNEPCHKKWYSIWTKCPCLRCASQQRRLDKLSDCGRYQRPDVSAAYETLQQMLDRGWSVPAIASACNLTRETLGRHVTAARTGTPLRMSVGVAHRIVNHGRPTAGTVDATGSRRRLQDLAIQRHSSEAVSGVNGLHPTTLSRIRRGSTPTITPQFADNIERAWRALDGTAGTSTLAAKIAARHGWAPAAAFDDIDDPTEEPKGLTLEHLAAQRGIKVASLKRAMRRGEGCAA